MENLDVITVVGGKPVLRLPNGTAGIVELPLADIVTAKNRIPEISRANTHTAPELMTCFNVAYLCCVDLLGKMRLILHENEKTRDRVHSEIILDRAAKVLAAKGLGTARNPGGSEQQRAAVVAADPEYAQCLDAVKLTEAAVELLRGYLKGFDHAYSATKKVYGDDQSWKQGLSHQHRNLSAGGNQAPFDRQEVRSAVHQITDNEPQEAAPRRHRGFGAT